MIRVTIWQQFSSNHSAGFTLVGKFESAERAQEAAEELRTMLREIGAWWEQADEEQVEELYKNNRITPPEEKYKNQYNVEWCRYYRKSYDIPIDWARDKYAAQNVRSYNHLVIIEPTGDTWTGEKPFVDILRTLGGEVAGYTEYDNRTLFMIVACYAPDETTAEQLESDARRIMDEWATLKQGYLSTYGSRNMFQREGRRFTYKLEHFFEAVEKDFAKVVMYLQAHGCTDIKCDVIEVSD